MNSMYDSDYLCHYGRPGMKWYQHVYGDNKTSTKPRAKTGSASSRARRVRKSEYEKLSKAQELFVNRDSLSDQELRQVLNRLQMESQLSQYANQKKPDSWLSKKWPQLAGLTLSAAGIGASTYFNIKSLNPQDAHSMVNFSERMNKNAQSIVKALGSFK